VASQAGRGENDQMKNVQEGDLGTADERQSNIRNRRVPTPAVPPQRTTWVVDHYYLEDEDDEEETEEEHDEGKDD